MQQDIRFCRTSDGVRIAFATAGEGPTLVNAAAWFGHVEFVWESPIMAWRNFNRLAGEYRIVNYDRRGSGLSDRSLKDFSLEAKVRDLEAVVDALSLRRFALFGQSEGGPTAISYAARHPERVDRLVLYASFGRFPHPMDTEEQRNAYEAVATLMRFGWGADVPAYRQMLTSLFMPDADASAARAFSEMERISASPEDAAQFFSQLPEIDVTDLLPKIKAPTLVVHRRGDNAVPFEAGRELASQIPGAKFIPLEGRNHCLLPGEAELERYFDVIRGFLAEGRKPTKRKARPSAVAAGLVTILFTDMEGSTPLTQRLGDDKAHEVLRTHNSVVRQALKEHSGSEIKHTGDGIMASFGSARRAIDCAIAIQSGLAEDDSLIRVRIGLNAGEPVEEEHDLFGTSVQLAARACAHAEPGQILVSNVVRELATGKGFLFADAGDVILKGFENPVRLYEVRWRN